MIRPVLLFSIVSVALAQEPPVPSAAPEVAAPAEQILRPPEPGRFKRLFQPFRTDMAALSPDGRYLAYSLRDGDTLSVAVIEIAHPEKMTAHVRVADDAGATPMLADQQREKTPARINWMGWVWATRLVVETNQVYTLKGSGEAGWQSWPGTLLAFDANGGNARQLANASDVADSVLDVIEANGRNLFSTRRDNSWLSSPAEPDGFTPSSGSLIGTVPDPEAPPPPVFTGASMAPRSPRIFGLDPARPGAVTLVATGAPRATGSRSIDFYSINGTTGKLTTLADGIVPAHRTPRIDRQGRLRLVLPDSTLAKFPFPYEYLGPKGRNRAQPLDTATGLAGFLVSPENYFGERAIPLGFDEDPTILYYASNAGRDTYGIYSFNLSTKQRGSLALENPAYDLIEPPGAGFPDLDMLVFDRFQHKLAGVRYTGAFHTTAWLRPEWQAVQTQMEQAFPGRNVHLFDWDEAGQRFLLSTEGPADPGAFYLYDRTQNKLMEFVRRAPWIDAHHVHTTLAYSFVTPDGARLSGLVTVPSQPRIKPIPMVVICPDTPWQRVRPDFQTEVQALADMGFVVVQFNGRGAWGLGLKHRQAITAGYDLVQVEDIATTVTNLEKMFAVNPRRVALLGRGHGAFIALRALQEHPGKFRCAVALETPVNLSDWLEEQRWTEDDVRPHLTRAWLGDAARLNAEPLARAPERITKPVLFLHYPGPDGEPRRANYVTIRGFANKVARPDVSAELVDLHVDYMRGLPAARAEVFDRIEEFLNVNVYDFNVKVRDLKILPDPTK